jgi:hypothetical protein
MARSAALSGLEFHAVCGSWPDIAGSVGAADVVTCHHVFYNVADLGAFVEQLSAHAYRRVVVEITAEHPLSPLNPLWERFYSVVRPKAPNALDVLAILAALGIRACHEFWRPEPLASAESFEDLVEVTTRRLCLPVERAAEVSAAISELGDQTSWARGPTSGAVEMVTMWWPGNACSGSGRPWARRRARQVPQRRPDGVFVCPRCCWLCVLAKWSN